MTQLAVKAQGGSASLQFTAATGTGSMKSVRVAASKIAQADVVIDKVSQVLGLSPIRSGGVGPALTGGSMRIMGREGEYSWRFTVRKLAMLARLQEGWDYDHSQPMNPLAEANYLNWLSGIPVDRLADAEPMLTDEGHILMEWRTNGFTRIAEIGPNYLCLTSLAPDQLDDDSEEFDFFDTMSLTKFFATGALR